MDILPKTEWDPPVKPEGDKEESQAGE